MALWALERAQQGAPGGRSRLSRGAGGFAHCARGVPPQHEEEHTLVRSRLCDLGFKCLNFLGSLNWGLVARLPSDRNREAGGRGAVSTAVRSCIFVVNASSTIVSCFALFDSVILSGFHTGRILQRAPAGLCNSLDWCGAEARRRHDVCAAHTVVSLFCLDTCRLELPGRFVPGSSPQKLLFYLQGSIRLV